MNRAKEQAYFSWKNSAKIHISTSSGESILEYLNVNSPANRMFISRDLTRLSKRRRWHVAFGMTSEFRSWSYMVVWLDCPQDKAVKCKKLFLVWPIWTIYLLWYESYFTTISTAIQEHSPDHPNDRLWDNSLGRWSNFKNPFFKWVDQPPTVTSD